MAWTAPVTWTAAQLVYAADLNAQLRDNLLHLATPLNTATGKIDGLTGACFLALPVTEITGVGHLVTANAYTVGKQNFNSGAGTTRLVIPVGADKWAV